MTLLKLFDITELKLDRINLELKDIKTPKEKLTSLKEEKEYLLDVLAILFKELERWDKKTLSKL